MPRGNTDHTDIHQQEALRNVKFLISKEMIMPTHPLLKNCYVNCTHLHEDEKDTFFTGVNNSKRHKFSRLSVKIKGGIKKSTSELEGKYHSQGTTRKHHCGGKYTSEI
jgi:hypothetical protein